MSAVEQINQQLKQDLQKELTTSNHLLSLISLELQQIKDFTNSGGDFENNIKLNASLIGTLANMQQVNLDNLPRLQRKQFELSNLIDQNKSYEQHESFRNASDMDQSQ